MLINYCCKPDHILFDFVGLIVNHIQQPQLSSKWKQAEINALKEPKVTKEQFKVSKNYAENVSILCKHVEENFFSSVN